MNETFVFVSAYDAHENKRMGCAQCYNMHFYEPTTVDTNECCV